MDCIHHFLTAILNDASKKRAKVCQPGIPEIHVTGVHPDISEKL